MADAIMKPGPASEPIPRSTFARNNGACRSNFDQIARAPIRIGKKRGVAGIDQSSISGMAQAGL